MLTHLRRLCPALILLLPLATAAIEFADPELELAVQQATPDPTAPLTDAALAQIVHLDATGLGISNLGGIEQLANLRILVLADNTLADIAQLSSLPSLAMLDLSGNQITDISALSSLRALTTLSLDFNQVADIGPLGELRRLEHVSLRGNRVVDMSPLVGLPSLVMVELTGNPLSAASVEEHIPALREDGAQVLYEPPPDTPVPPPEQPAFTWTLIGPHLERQHLRIHTMAIAPSNPEVMYCVAGRTACGGPRTAEPRGSGRR